MKKKLASQLSAYDVHAFTDIVRETVLDSEKRVKNELKSYIDQKLEETSGKFDQKLEETSGKFDQKLEETSGKFDQKLEETSKALLNQIEVKNQEQTQELVKLMDLKNREQTDEIVEVIQSMQTVNDKLYVTKEEFKKHTSNIRAHQS